VEWDDPTRGKHDGSHAGVRYFTCVTTDGATPGVRAPRGGCQRSQRGRVAVQLRGEHSLRDDDMSGISTLGL